MRFARVLHADGVRWAQLEGVKVHTLAGAPWVTTQGVSLGDFREANLRAPVEPFKILCIGRNYVAHAKELGNEVPKEPLLFLKPKTALIGHGGVIELPPESARVEYEAELGVVIGKTARRVPREKALDYVFGY